MDVMDFLQVAMDVMEAGKSSDHEKLFLIAWDIWHRRNQQIFEGKNIQPVTVIDKAMSIAAKYKEVKDVRHPRKIQSSCWQPPSQGVLKLNVDGAIFED